MSQVRWLIVIRRDNEGLYQMTRESFQGRAVVIFDRRFGERRTQQVPIEVERRQRPRRQPLSPQEQMLWNDAHYRMVYRPEGFDPSETERPAYQ
jgi:hypothetical protein